MSKVVIPGKSESRRLLGGISCRYRNMLGFGTREQLAALAGVDTTVVRFVEKGEGATPSSDDIRKVFAVFLFENVDDLSILDLMIKKVAKPAPEPPQRLFIPPTRVRFPRLYMRG